MAVYLPFPTFGHPPFSMPTRVSVLNKPRDVYVDNILVIGEIQNAESTKPESSEDRLRALFSTVALNAILNAGGRGDEVRCHPGTQERVIEMLETGMGGKADSPDAGSKILWLSGRAGTGKSAIMQTVAERQKARGRPAPNFFFFREDDTRSHANYLVATLLYQLMESLADQFSKLIASPIDTIVRQDAFPGHEPITLLVDGLDECSSSNKFKPQQQQVKHR
ncbi:hypothetical protein D9619_011485 [Psilocybe cf. subviscida]|uniref:NACHT domain-containing protein n=1 Tax=Psilocybe cf. subviscida TaxID=2480587 RepID=A0A8H5BSF0_9AGAR|nr:hypothetical protein D9619_011485 [Psilocybe cf. subviscida]